MRVEIQCPVRILVRGKGEHHVLLEGQLRDICEGGARVAVQDPPARGKLVTMDVRFAGPNEQVTTVRFEGVVARVSKGPPSEIAVRFRRRGRFLRGDLFNFFSADGSGRVQ